MATVGASLKLFDQFSSTLTRAQQVMDSTIVTAGRLRQSLHGTISFRITLDSSSVLTQAQALRVRIQQQLGQITARIRLEMPSSLTVFFTNLQRLVLRLLAAVERLNRNVGGSNAAQLQAALQRIAILEQQILTLQGQVNQRIREGSSAAGGLAGNMDKIASAYIAIAAAKKAMQVSDDYINSQARLNIVNDNKQTPQQLQAAVFDAANRARGDYVTMASSVAKLGLLAGDAFGGNSEVLKFTELMQKSFKVSGASTQESQAGMYQLTQAMASGKLQGDEFRSIMENAPMLAQAIATYTGKTKGELKKMSAEGTITANIIKGALFSAADDINAKFKTMPKTFGDVMTLLKNDAIQGFGTVIEQVNKLMNSPGGNEFFEGISGALRKAANGTAWFVGVLTNHMGIVKNILVSVGAVVTALTVKWLIHWAVAAWPIFAVIGAIALLLTVLNAFGVSTKQVMGIVAGIFMVAFATIYNSIALGWNMILAFVDFLANIFHDPVYAVKKLFFDLGKSIAEFFGTVINGIVSALNLVVKGINKVSKANISIIPQMDMSKLSDMEAPTSSSRHVSDLSSKYRMGQMDYGTAFNNGNNFVGGMFDKVGAALSGWDDIPNIDKVNEVGKIGDTVDISNEDLKAMRELAEMKSIQNFITLTPTVQVTGDNHYHAQGDVEDMIGQLTVALQTHMDSSVDGVTNT
ncbi:tape measure protein [Paenibacillus sp. 2RAB27]|uniref:tape measure protein n=1 Tax=Paenibacillus sp. 2RAB27 TaxID=3232991 RepID=UPI003F9E9B58